MLIFPQKKYIVLFSVVLELHIHTNTYATSMPWNCVFARAMFPFSFSFPPKMGKGFYFILHIKYASKNEKQCLYVSEVDLGGIGWLDRKQNNVHQTLLSPNENTCVISSRIASDKCGAELGRTRLWCVYLFLLFGSTLYNLPKTLNLLILFSMLFNRLLAKCFTPFHTPLPTTGHCLLLG